MIKNAEYNNGSKSSLKKLDARSSMGVWKTRHSYFNLNECGVTAIEVTVSTKLIVHQLGCIVGITLTAQPE